MTMNIRTYAGIWLAALAVVVILLVLFQNILLPFVAGMAVAYFLDPVADRLERAGLSRTLATTIITAAFTILVVLFLIFAVPLLQGQIIDFQEKPQTDAEPPSGVRNPVSIFMVVDLPAPLGPRKPSTSPGLTSNDRLSTAT